MRDEKRRGSGLLENAMDVFAHVAAEARVQVGEGLVEQQQVRIRRQSARQSHALLFASG